MPSPIHVRLSARERAELALTAELRGVSEAAVLRDGLRREVERELSRHDESPAAVEGPGSAIPPVGAAERGP